MEPARFGRLGILTEEGTPCVAKALSNRNYPEKYEPNPHRQQLTKPLPPSTRRNRQWWSFQTFRGVPGVSHNDGWYHQGGSDLSNQESGGDVDQNVADEELEESCQSGIVSNRHRASYDHGKNGISIVGCQVEVDTHTGNISLVKQSASIPAAQV